MAEKIPDSIKQEMEKLVRNLNYHGYRYYFPLLALGRYNQAVSNI